jgi:hypothetical protein
VNLNVQGQHTLTMDERDLIVENSRNIANEFQTKRKASSCSVQ